MATRVAEIAGAGLSGLVLAARLAQLGWKVTLHERGKDLRMFGAGIWLWENGLKSLKIIGAYEAAVARAKVIKEWRIVDHRGKTLMARPFFEGDRMLVPPRADLYQALIDRVTELGVDIRTSSVAVGAKPEGVLILESGEERQADLVIGADGVGSRVREAINAMRWADYGVEAGIRMLIDHRDGDPDDVVTEYWNGPWRLLYNPCTGGQNYIFLGAPVDDPRTRLPVDRDLWHETFPALEGLITRFEEAGRWDRVLNIKCRTWSEGKVAIVGDAAHGMPPNLGQAANMAFTNVMALAMAVSDGASDVPAALARWEGRQRPLTDHVQWWSYIYGYVVAKWPLSLQTLRSDVIRNLAKTDWFEEGLNKGPRHVPDGYRALLR